jgi:hypothetical protein
MVIGMIVEIDKVESIWLLKGSQKMYELNKLSRQDIETRYQGKPILIDKKWYIVSDVYSSMPLHMLTRKESDLYIQDKSSIEGIKLYGQSEGYSYVMWINFNQDGGWDAYGYE